MRKHGWLLNSTLNTCFRSVRAWQAAWIIQKTKVMQNAQLAAEICLKKLRHIPGHIKGRSISTKQVLATENLRMELESEKEKSKALEEQIRIIKEEQLKFQDEQAKYKEEQNEKIKFMMGELVCLS